MGALPLEHPADGVGWSVGPPVSSELVVFDVLFTADELSLGAVDACASLLVTGVAALVAPDEPGLVGLDDTEPVGPELGAVSALEDDAPVLDVAVALDVEVDRGASVVLSLLSTADVEFPLLLIPDSELHAWPPPAVTNVR